MRRTLHDHPTWPNSDRRTDDELDTGYTVVELLLVIAILATLGVLIAVATLLVTGINTEAADTGCHTDRRQLHLAVSTHEAQTRSPTIPPSGADDDPDRYERGLVDGGFLRNVSELHHVAADGTVTPEDPRC